ncbi:hypothetical protein N44_01638 [Microcystis aeruginosa NIES-44]|uniref:Uncharacterized protein n=1 Tax=Microcystis aeruginosa NIES-44 TaxID=449439 RepID=A0A0A1VUM8_MICAE|nr:hypothetical protein N44_01638 [Microcystis aeruginosa NIES-44]
MSIIIDNLQNQLKEHQNHRLSKIFPQHFWVDAVVSWLTLQDLI